ncbi:MAG: ACP S-malonyltransferase [Bacilli bacterium]
MHKLGIIFVGQGSQYPKMGLDFLSKFPSLQQKVDEASWILGYDVVEALSSDEAQLRQTRFTQPLLLLASLFAYEVFKTLNPSISAYAGFSLGEYGAYYASGLFSFAQIIRIINYRAIVMEECSQRTNGKMVAVLGMDIPRIEEIAKENQVYVANYNSPKQIVVSGPSEALAKFTQKATFEGAKRVIPLNVSGAFHSPLMNEAKTKLLTFLKAEEYEAKDQVIYGNLTGNIINLKRLPNTMAKQLASPVLFIDMINNMSKDGVSHIVEMGPGNVLSGLIKQINSQIQVSHFGKLEEYDEIKGWLTEYGFIK